MIVDDSARGGDRDWIDRPALHARFLAVGAALRFCEHRLVRDDVDDHLAVGGFICIGGVENIAGLDRHPDDTVAAAFPGEEADAVFAEAMKVVGVSAWRRTIMHLSLIHI